MREQGVEIVVPIRPASKRACAPAQLAGLLKRSLPRSAVSAAVGTETYMLADRPRKIRLSAAEFVVVDSCTLVRYRAITGVPLSQTQAMLALRAHLRTRPEDQGRLTVLPRYAEAA